MNTLQTAFSAFVLGIGALGAPAFASTWSEDHVLGRNITFYSPTEIDRKNDTPLVMVFDDTARSGTDLAERFALWHHASEGGFKIVYSGDITDGAKGNQVPSHDDLMPMAVEMALTTGNYSAANIYVVGFGDAAARAINFACRAPGLLRAVVALDYEGPKPGEAFFCDDAAGLLVLSVHDGEPAEAAVRGAKSSRNTDRIDAALEAMSAGGAKVRSIFVEGPDEDFPSLAAKFHEQSGVSLESLVATFVAKTIR